MMHHSVDDANIQILFVLDVGNKIIRLHQLLDDFAKTAFVTFLRR